MSRPEPQHEPSPTSEDSENYDANNESSPSQRESSPPSSSSSPLILYSPPTIWGLLRGAGINLILPFINGLMLGFGELLAHEVAFRWGWSETKVCEEIPWPRMASPSLSKGQGTASGGYQQHTDAVHHRYSQADGKDTQWDQALRYEKIP